MKQKLTINALVKEAKIFCEQESKFDNRDLFGITDGKAVGTFIEHKFQDYLSSNYEYLIGSSANGIDMPSEDLNTDIKVTSIKQPQSSCPFRNAKQKIYGLGYNLLVLVYDKNDDPTRKMSRLNFVSCSFIDKNRTADYQVTRTIRQMLENNANADDIIAYLTDRNLPTDEILRNKPEQGYLTISNALQWRLQYGRIVELTENVNGIIRIISKT
ncbi:MAG: restriction endonuclease [Planctomycetes bacterium GWA2_39_15]|nr:MAG: restriction endonuclease [Planctomycetes bacterium GWA2_39_15]OHB42817.1 MAG: restriction endonuclease [Planctomycetes bacterium GWC2_39_26]